MTREGRRPSSLLVTLVSGLFALLALAWFKYGPAPFLGPLVLAGILCLMGLGVVVSQIGQSLLVTLATILFTVAGAEAFWWHKIHSGPPNLDYPENYLASDPVVGYAAVKGASIRMRREYHDTLLYDVQYTIDSTGLRTSPPPSLPSPTECILFFGDSYTFGEGIDNAQAMPYQVAMGVAGRYHIFNFGLHGYGPHQMLALLQSGRVKRVLDCTPRYAIYLAIPDHVARAAGRRPGGRGPRYALRADGTVARQPRNIGDEDEGVLTVGAYVRSQFEKSALVTLLRSRVETGDWDLFFGIVGESARLVKDSFPGCKFEVITWDDPPEPRLADGLRRLGLGVHELSNVVPGYRADPWSFRIPIDGHPNVKAQTQTAQYVLTQILQATPADGVTPPAPPGDSSQH